MALTIVATIRAQPGREGLVEAELLKLVEPTRNEDGCLQYDLHTDHETPGHFLFYENWKNRELWQAHMNSSHLAAFAAATEGAVAELTIYEMGLIA